MGVWRPFLTGKYRSKSDHARKYRKLLTFDVSRVRYRCLQAIVKGVFPHDSIEATEDLLALGRREGFPMPDKFSLSTGSELGKSPSMLNQEMMKDAQRSELSVTLDSEDREPPALPQGLCWQGGRNTTNHASRLVCDSSGGRHYIGPYGSLSFFAQLRDLVSERHPSSRFAVDNVAEALEARPDPLPSPNAKCDGNKTPAVSSPESSMSTSSTWTRDLHRSAIRLRSLPSRITQLLLHVFFMQVNSNFPLFHRAMFLDELERYFVFRKPSGIDVNANQSANDEFQRNEGWLVCLHAMLLFGCMLVDNTQAKNLQDERFNGELFKSECWNLSRAALPHLTTTCSQSNVQALLLIALYYHGNNERNSAWTVVGCAIRISIALGLHRDDVKGTFGLVERETRRLIFCTLYTFEEFLCMSLGRPSALDQAEVNVSVPSGDMLDTNHVPPGYVQKSFELQQLSSKIRKGMSAPIHAVEGAYGDHESVVRSASYQRTEPKGLLDLLESWEKTLPTHLLLPETLDHGNSKYLEPMPSHYAQISPHHIRALCLLHLQYHNLIIIVTRPYLLLLISLSATKPQDVRCAREGHPTAPSTSLGGTGYLAKKCVSSASRVTKLVILLNELGLLNGLGWLDVFYAYSAGMVLLLRIFWTSYASHDQDITQEEKKLTTQLQTQVMKLRQVLRALKKSPTMDRFASVMENFAEAVTSPSEEIVTSTSESISVDTFGLNQGSAENEIMAHLPKQSMRKQDRADSGPPATTTDTESSKTGTLPRRGEASESLEWASSRIRGMDSSIYLPALYPAPVLSDETATIECRPQAHDGPNNDLDRYFYNANGCLTRYLDQQVPVVPSASYQPRTLGQEENVGNANSYALQTDDFYTMDSAAVTPLTEQQIPPNSWSWQNTCHAAAQHAISWNDFELFLGNLEEG